MTSTLPFEIAFIVGSICMGGIMAAHTTRAINIFREDKAWEVVFFSCLALMVLSVIGAIIVM